ncbi:MAG: response regulator [Erysipelotrichales bacterium]|nr:response regulator [Erysipelotrichales bacterium]
MKFTAVSKLKPGMIIGQSIQGVTDLENYVCGSVLCQSDINLFKEKGLFGIYTMEGPNEILSPSLMRRCLDALKHNTVNSMFLLSKEIVEEMKAKPLSLDFRSIRSYEDYLPHHSVCVAVYAVAIGIKMGMVDTQLNALALAGLLHDIGQTFSDQSVLIKQSKLEPEEYELIKRHTTDGYDFVANHNQIPTIVKDAILHHHENINGTGYPDRLKDNNISSFARIIHIVDVYDAIMSKRPYKNGMSSAEAINYLIGGKTILFDEKFVDVFTTIAVPYPTGSTVRLSNQEIATVIGQNTNKQRPVVYIEEKQMIVNLATNPSYHDINVLIDIEYEQPSEATIINLSDEVVEKTGKKKIMIVDDVYVSITYTKLALGDNYDIVTCMGGSKAAAMVSEERPDLILMDYEMPDMDGVTAANQIHKLGYNIPIIFLTGKGNPEIVYECIRCGAVDYILKPANPVYLRTRVEMAIHNLDGNTFL